MIIIVDYPITYTYSVATFKPDWDIPAEPLIDDAGENGFPVVSLVVNPIYTPLRRNAGADRTGCRVVGTQKDLARQRAGG